MIENILVLAIVAHAVGFWALLWYSARLRRQLRCLGYCYLDISDWAIGEFEALRRTIEIHDGPNSSPKQLIYVDQEWAEKLKKHKSLLARVGKRPPGQYELDYRIDG